jgi:hypothetical protein
MYFTLICLFSFFALSNATDTKSPKITVVSCINKYNQEFKQSQSKNGIEVSFDYWIEYYCPEKQQKSYSEICILNACEKMYGYVEKMKKSSSKKRREIREISLKSLPNNDESFLENIQEIGESSSTNLREGSKESSLDDIQEIGEPSLNDIQEIRESSSTNLRGGSKESSLKNLRGFISFCDLDCQEAMDFWINRK